MERSNSAYNLCLECGKDVHQIPGRKRKKFCCDDCRSKWWKRNRMTYNSNHIEGSKLSEDQTRLIFETNTLDVGYGIPVDDVLETAHHFRAIDYVIDIAEDELTEDIIKYLHYILKHDTKDSTLGWFAVGDYRKRAYVVGGRETSKPSDVHKHMMALLKEYNAKENVTVEDIIALHAYQGTHAARASICTNLLGNLSDVGVQHQMGHSDIAITRKYYQRFKTSVKEMREKMNNLIQY